MTWYRFSYRAGPGHQSSDEVFQWLEGEWSDDDLKEVWQESIPEWARYSDSVVGEHEALDRLPENQRLLKLQFYRERLGHAQRMIAVLESQTPENAG